MAIRQFKTSQGITDRNTLSVKNYLRELNRFPMLSIEEEVQLSRERVRQIREKAVVKMKKSDNSHLLFKYLG